MANQLTTTSALIDSELMDVNLKPEVVTLPFLTITVADDVYPFLSMLTITVGIFANLYGNTTSCSSLLTANVISTDPCCKLLPCWNQNCIFLHYHYQKRSNLEWKYVADVIGSSTINIPSDACEIFVTVTKSSVIYDGVTTLSLLVPVRILSTVYQDFLNGGYGNNDQQTYLAFFRINKYNAHLYALKVAGQDYTATSQLKMWYR